MSLLIKALKKMENLSYFLYVITEIDSNKKM